MKKMEQRTGFGLRVAGLHCKKCNKPLTKRQITIKQKYCCGNCYWLDKVGKKHDWGDKISKALKGKSKSKQHIENARLALIGRKRPEITGKKHFAWKGNKVGLDALHDWVRRHKGIPANCEKCGKTNLKHRQYHWSNISGKYKRVLSDWQRLCVKCHSNFDRNK